MATVLLNIIAIFYSRDIYSIRDNLFDLHTNSAVVRGSRYCIVSIVREQLQETIKRNDKINYSLCFHINVYSRIRPIGVCSGHHFVRDWILAIVVDADYDDYTEEEKETIDRNIPEFVKRF